MRRAFAAIVTASGFAVVAAQLISIGFSKPPRQLPAPVQQFHHAAARPDIIGRNGETLATDVPIYWLHADPAIILNAKDTAEQLAHALPGLNVGELQAKLRGKSRFVWIKRGLTPKDAAAIYNLGQPGLTLSEERQRYYPAGANVAHVLGQTNVDNLGLNGIEKVLDKTYNLAAGADTPRGLPKLRTTLDLRLQHALRDELLAAQDFFGAKAAAGVLMNVNTGEVLALSSLPDYDPNRREGAQAEGRRNHITADIYELGSVFKAFTIAMVIDEGLAAPSDVYDIAAPLRIGGFSLLEHHARGKTATVEEILERSHNLGAARLALKAGPARQQAFLRKLGLLAPLELQTGVTAAPLLPNPWREVNTVTISYGHGISVTPLSFAAAACTLINGGYKITPHFIPSSDGSVPARGERILNAATSDAMRRMLRATVENGTGRQAQVPGYAIGGKTGTAKKPKNGVYSDDVITSFFAAFPINAPEFLVFVMLDEPRRQDGAPNNEAAYNAVPSAGATLKRIIPILGIPPENSAIMAATSK
jgi:cell division protein FtsI (penicillin-binding protein 3)